MDPLQASLLSAIGTLSGVVAYLWRQQAADHGVVTKKLEECSAHHLTVSVELATIKGEQAGTRTLAEQVLKTVADVAKQGKSP